jgi:hypothetical protein
MSSDAILLCDGHVDKFIVAICPDKIQSLFELGAEAPAEAIALLCIGVGVITRILAQVVENL